MDGSLLPVIPTVSGHTKAVQMLMEAERAKPGHVRKSELNHDKPRIRSRDLANKGRFRLPATFALSSESLKYAVSSGQSSISLAHEGRVRPPTVATVPTPQRALATPGYM
jgi:hypothetical protein